MNEVGRKKRL
jgi:hypothetical protein